MSINPHWARWIHTSLAVYFKVVADGLPLKLIVEGVDEREPEKMNVDHAELRINGPFIREVSANYYLLNVDTNILCTDLMGGASDNPYDLQRWIGKFQEAAWQPIPIFRYGLDIAGVDDSSQLGCLVPRTRKDSTSAYQFGQVSVNSRVRQAAVDTRHVIEIT